MGNKVHFILDEAASLGPNMHCVEDAIDKYRAYNIRLQLYYQSPAQLKKCFPEGQDQTVLANMTQVYFAVNDTSAEYVSNRLGDQTVIVDSGGSGRSSSVQRPDNLMNGSTTYSTNTNENWNQMARRLLKPEEILCLDERIAITFVPGLPPICTRLERYYESRAGSSRFSGLVALCKASLLAFGSTLMFLASLAYLGNQ